MKLVSPDLIKRIKFARNAPATRECAQLSLRCMDYTSLTGTETKEQIQDLADTAKNTHTASLCIYPQFVATAARTLRGASTHATTVINFPYGNKRTLSEEGADKFTIKDDITKAVADGAKQVDIVLPYVEFLNGSRHIAEEFLRAARDACPNDVTLMCILESGAFYHEQNLRKAARIAISQGVNFIKSSTGKFESDGKIIGATFEAAAIMFAEANAVTGSPVGVKLSGGIRTVEEAAKYMELHRLIRPGLEITPNVFRIGASGLLQDVLRYLAPNESVIPPRPNGY
jgi:deoxyribose-phosphate aldolase